MERRSAIASTEPCTGVHGKALGVSPADDGKALLQRSRAPECTERGDLDEIEGWHDVRLQRSRAPECTESRDGSQTHHTTDRRFNGAVHRSARKGDRLEQAGELVRGPLQRSRAPECTESNSTPQSHERPRRASTEPCTGVHGKRQRDARMS